MNANARDNYGFISAELRLLEGMYTSKQFKDFWLKIKEVGQQIKTSYLEKSQRDELWSRFSGIYDRAKQQIQERNSRSEVCKNGILSRILLMTGTGSPVPINLFDLDEIEESSQIFETIRSARQELSFIREDIDLHKDDLTREDRQECWDAINAANNRLNDLYRNLCDRNYNRLSGEVNKVWNEAGYDHVKPRDVKNEIKQIQSRLRQALLTKDQRSELRDHLEKAWEEATSRAEELHSQRQERHDQWRSNQESWIEYQLELQEKDREYIDSLYVQIGDLQERISSSRSSSYVSKAEGWISEKESKIEEVERRCQDREERIAEAQAKLDDDQFRR